MPYKDPTKQKEAQHQHYLSNLEKYKASSRISKRNRSKWFRELKQTMQCSKCDESRWQCLDFHHPDEVRPDRGKTPKGNRVILSVGYLASSFGKKRTLEEIKKCIVLCANCHRMEHWDEEEQMFI